MKGLTVVVFAVVLTGCSAKWPSDRFPAAMEVKRTLFAGGGGLGFRETCEAIVVEITRDAAIRTIRLKKAKGRVALEPPAGWNNTPITVGGGRTYYEGAFGGCDNDGDGPLGDLPGALKRPGAFYKIINGGEGIAIIAPRAKLAGFYYFG